MAYINKRNADKEIGGLGDWERGKQRYRELGDRK
jgi:hypothetical protein